MTLVTKDGNYKIIDGELFKEVESPDGMVYLERYVGEEMETINVYAYNTNIISSAYNRGIVIYAPSKKEAVKMFSSFKMVKIGDRSGGKREMLEDKVNSQIAMLESLIFQNKVYFNEEVIK